MTKRPRPSHPTPVAEILRGILARKQPGIADQRDRADEAVKSCLTPQNRDRIQVSRIAGDAAEVSVDTSSLLHELRAFHHEQILKALRSVDGCQAITRVRYKLGTVRND